MWYRHQAPPLACPQASSMSACTSGDTSLTLREHPKNCPCFAGDVTADTFAMVLSSSKSTLAATAYISCRLKSDICETVKQQPSGRASYVQWHGNTQPWPDPQILNIYKIHIHKISPYFFYSTTAKMWTIVPKALFYGNRIHT
jgi:hypothetical protein